MTDNCTDSGYQSTSGEQGQVVVCAHTYYTDLLDRHAFVFLLAGTGQRFTLYHRDPVRYLLGATYQLRLAPTPLPDRPEDPRPAPAPADRPHSAA